MRQIRVQAKSLGAPVNEVEQWGARKDWPASFVDDAFGFE